MSFTIFDGKRQIRDDSIPLIKLSTNFLLSQTWNVSTSNDATITGLADPVNNNDAANKIYVDTLISSSTNWLKTTYDADGDGTNDEYKLYPADNRVKRMEIKENTRGINTIYIENSNTSDNYTGSSVVLTTDSADYTNQTYIAHHGPSYYDPYLASRGAIMTDSSMIIGAYNSTDQQGVPAFVSFIVGDDYYNQKEIFKLTVDGLKMTLPDKKFWYEAGKTVQNHPSNYTQLFCNTGTSEVYAGVPSMLGSVRAISTSNITLNDTQTIDGVALNSGDRVLVSGQTDAKENGIYICLAGANWTRAGDLPSGSACAGKIVVVNEGTVFNVDSLWEFSNNSGSDIIDTDNITLKILANGPANVGNGLHYNSGLIKLGGELDEYTGFNMHDGVYMSWTGNYINSDSTQLSFDIFGGNNSNSQNGYFEVLLQDPNHFEYISGLHLEFNYSEFGYRNGIIHITSSKGELQGNSDLWVLQNSPSGSENKAIATVEYVNNSISASSSSKTTEKYILTTTDITNGYIDIINSPLGSEHLFVYLNGLYLDENTDGDFTITLNRITFNNDLTNVLEVNDKIIVKYSY